MKLIKKGPRKTYEDFRKIGFSQNESKYLTGISYGKLGINPKGSRLFFIVEDLKKDLFYLKKDKSLPKEDFLEKKQALYFKTDRLVARSVKGFDSLRTLLKSNLTLDDAKKYVQENYNFLSRVVERDHKDLESVLKPLAGSNLPREEMIEHIDSELKAIRGSKNFLWKIFSEANSKTNLW